jgi:RNA polymerase sigma-70 factor (ECF subfamily)
VSLPVDEVLRIEGGRVLATLIRLTGDFDLAEDALQDAVLVALERWPRTGVPDSPAAWLTTTARNKALDRIRREARRAGKEQEAVGLLDDAPPPSGDDRLRLLFTSCHPALSPDARVALTLRTICGLRTSEIAAAFLVSETTIGQRITRAKRKIATARIPYRIPPTHEWPDRLPSVLAAVYVVFTTGHHAPGGAMTGRVELAAEAIRLGRMLRELMPDEPEVTGLLALMLATHARRAARIGPGGEQVLLEDQDRGAWDHAAIAEAAELVDASIRRSPAGPYRLEAAIACLHGLAPDFDHTDWPQIVELYRMLESVKPGPVVRVNRAVAEAMVAGPAAGLALLEDLAGADRWHLAWAARGALLDRAADPEGARAAYLRALSLEMNDADRRLLERRVDALDARPKDRRP